ncbi:MAG: alpha/beta hydrolase [Candidatus Binatia bacterium]
MLEVRLGAFRAEAHSAENPRYRSRVLLVHGLWGGAWCWRHYGSFLAHRGWEVLAVDLRGRPGSAPARVESVTLEEYTRDLEDVLGSDLLAARDEEDRMAPVVIGHDLGGLLGLSLARGGRCRAAIALAPPLPGTLREEYRALLGRARRWLSRSLPPPAELPDEPSFDASRLQADSGVVGRALLRGEMPVAPPDVPALVVAGDRDLLIEGKALEARATAMGADFSKRAAPHWGLEDPEFERQVDQLHRWLVKRIGSDLLRMTGWEDLDEDEQP